MAGGQSTESPVIRFRTSDREVHEVQLRDARVGDLATASPWRTFRWHRGQKHYPGWWWSSTTRSHVVYESRLELARLILADFDRDVRVIVAQPFQIQARIDGQTRRHVPDFLLVDGNDAAKIVNVKPAERLQRPKVAEALGWPHGLFEQRGWQTEIWSGADTTLMANVRFLAGFRRGELLDRDAVAAVAADVEAAAATIGTVETTLSERWPVPLIRPAILHLLWHGMLRTDLSEPLDRDTILEAA